MSIYMIFSPPKEGVVSFLWKINNFGEIVIEHIDDNATGIVASGRKMCVVGSIKRMRELSGNMNLALNEIPDCEMRLVEIPSIYQYGVSDVDELVARLNAKGNNRAKILMNALSPELRYRGVVWNWEVRQWEKRVTES